MDIMNSYHKFSEQVDQCDDIDQLQNYKKANSVNALRNAFWEQRQIALSTQDPLEKQRALVKLQWLQQYFGCQIPIRRNISQFTAPEGLFGIQISSRASIDSGCVIFPHVCISANTLPDSPNAGFPIIGKNVHIGTGAVICGNVLVGNHARIESNCCVTSDVSANTLVSAAPVQAVRQNAPLNNQRLSPEQFHKQKYETVLCEDTSSADLITRIATVEDIEPVFQLYKERVAWLKWKKITQWGSYLHNHPKEEFLQKLASGEYYVIIRNGEIIGGFSLSLDSEQWKDNTTNAYYLCRAVSKIGYHHLGAYMVAEAKRITREAGKTALRLECVYANKKLNELWEQFGFAYVRDETDPLLPEDNSAE